MKRADLTEKILDIKREKGWSWRHICTAIGGFSDTLIVGALLGQMKLTKPQAAKAAELFGLAGAEELEDALAVLELAFEVFLGLVGQLGRHEALAVVVPVGIDPHQ